MNWLWVMAGAIGLRAFYSIATKLVTTNIRIHHSTLSTLLVFSSAFMALLLSPFFGGLNFDGLGGQWPKVLVMVTTLGVGNIIYFKGQDMVDSGTTQVALASKLVWTALLAIPLLGASYDVLQVGGMAILALAIIIVAGGLTSKVASTGALIIALSAVSFSINSLTSADIANEVSAPAYLILSFVGAGLISLVAGLKYVRKDVGYIVSNKKITLKYAGFASATSLFYFIALYYAFRAAGEDRGLAAILTNAQVVTTVILASIILREKDNLMRKLVAGLLVLLAAYLISGV